MIEAQNYPLAQSAAIDAQQNSFPGRPLVLRNSRILLGLTFLGSAASFVMCLCMTVLIFTSIFPIHSMNFDRAAAAFLWAVGAWLMAASNVFLWRQGQAMAYCSVLLDNDGAHFKLSGKNDSNYAFMPWSGIEAVHYKRIPGAQKFTILGEDTSTVTFTSYTFYRPKKIARLIAQRTGLPLVRG